MKKLFENWRKFNLLNESIDSDLSAYIDQVYENILDYEELNQDKPHRLSNHRETLAFIRELRSPTILGMMGAGIEPKHLNIKGTWNRLITQHDSASGAMQMPGYQKMQDILASYEHQTQGQHQQYQQDWQEKVVAAAKYRSWQEIPRDIYESSGI
mgnify:CR=1 FL=1